MYKKSKCIKAKSNCIKDTIYIDDGISGCNTKNRDEFNRMISECLAGNINMIVTKSISRFARNTLDCLKYIRQLKEKNIPVFFEKENINTMDTKGEVLLTIMASCIQGKHLILLIILPTTFAEKTNCYKKIGRTYLHPSLLLDYLSTF